MVGGSRLSAVRSGGRRATRSRCIFQLSAKNKLKNGMYSVKEKTLFPGCIFLHCILNKEPHDFVREWNGIGGFLGSKGNSKQQINRPKPVAAEEIGAIFQQAKEEQEKVDRAFLEENHLEGIMDDGEINQFPVVGKRRCRSKRASKPSTTVKQENADDKCFCKRKPRCLF